VGGIAVKKFKITVNNKIYNIDIEKIVDEKAFVTVNSIGYEVDIERVREKRLEERGTKDIESVIETPIPAQRRIDTEIKPSASSTGDNKGGKIMAPLSGLIIDLLIKEGDRVKAGETVIRMEAMKMENDIISPGEGVIKKIMVTKGMEVREGEVLVELSKV
jgi:biotin carboxyl carrier protein